MNIHLNCAHWLSATALLLCSNVAAAHEKHAPAKVIPVPAAKPAIVDATSPVATIKSFHDALTRGDTTTALGLMHEDVNIFESGVVEQSRAEYASHHLAADAEFSASVKRVLVNRSIVERGDLAVVTSIETVNGTFKARAISSRSLETMTLGRVNGQWRIVHIHWSSKALNK